MNFTNIRDGFTKLRTAFRSVAIAAFSALTFNATTEKADAAIITINATGIDELGGTVVLTTTLDTDIPPDFIAPTLGAYFNTMTGFSGTITPLSGSTIAFSRTSSPSLASGDFSVSNALVAVESDEADFNYNFTGSDPILDMDFEAISPFTTVSDATAEGVPAIINNADSFDWTYEDALGNTIDVTATSVTATSVPEPSSAALVGLGTLALMRRDRRKKASPVLELAA